MSTHKTKRISDIKISRASGLKLDDFDEYRSSIDFSNPCKIKKILTRHFTDGEHDTFLEILALFMGHIGKTRISRETKIPERTIYNFIKGQHKTSSENIFKVMKFISKEAEKKSV